MKSTCRDITPVSATAPSLYGTWIILPPRRCASISPARWPDVPLPADAKVTPCGRAANAVRSLSDFSGESAATTSSVGV
jgi:hypothetical protein